MSLLVPAIQNDMIVQIRKNFYSVSLILAILFAVVFSLFFKADHIKTLIPAAMLLIVGGTSLIFSGGLIIDEKDKGILNAIVLSPMSTGEYLGGKIISLTFLSTLEVGIMVAGPLAWFAITQQQTLPDLKLLALGIISLNLIYSLLGVVITVRFKKVTDYMIPVVLIMIFLQLPIIYYAGIIKSSLLLIVPSAAPIMIIQGAFSDIEQWKWIYALIYTGFQILVLILWSRKAFTKHIVDRMG